MSQQRPYHFVMAEHAMRSSIPPSKNQQFDALIYALWKNKIAKNYQLLQAIEQILKINPNLDSKETTSPRPEKLSDRIITEARKNQIEQGLEQADSATVKKIYNIILGENSKLSGEVNQYLERWVAQDATIKSLLKGMLYYVRTPFSSGITDGVLNDLSQYSEGVMSQKENKERVNLLKQELTQVKEARKRGELTVLQETMIVDKLLNSPEFFPVNKGKYHEILEKTKANFQKERSFFLKYSKVFIKILKHDFLNLFGDDFQKEKENFLKKEKNYLGKELGKNFPIERYRNNILESELFINQVKQDWDVLNVAVKRSVLEKNNDLLEQLQQDSTFRHRLEIFDIDIDEYRETYAGEYSASLSRLTSSSSSSSSSSSAVSASTQTDKLDGNFLASPSFHKKKTFGKKSQIELENPSQFWVPRSAASLDISSLKDLKVKGKPPTKDKEESSLEINNVF